MPAGTIVSISGSDRTIDALLKDPIVVAIEESRPSGQMESARSLPCKSRGELPRLGRHLFREGVPQRWWRSSTMGIDVLHEAFLDDGGRSRFVVSGISRTTTNRHRRRRDLSSEGSTLKRMSRAMLQGRRLPLRFADKNNGHGTHVASIAAGRKAGNFAGGVAPEAQLLIVISNGDQPRSSRTYCAHLHQPDGGNSGQAGGRQSE